MVAGKAPPPWANATLKLGNFSNIPLKIIEQIALLVSAGIPTSQGSQYFSIWFFPIIFHGCTNIQEPKSAAASNIGKNF